MIVLESEFVRLVDYVTAWKHDLQYYHCTRHVGHTGRYKYGCAHF